jgi:hypothetical protein
MVIYLEDYVMRRRNAAASPVVRLAVVAGAAAAAVAARAALTPWQSVLTDLGLAPGSADPRSLYAEATLV